MGRRAPPCGCGTLIITLSQSPTSPRELPMDLSEVKGCPACEEGSAFALRGWGSGSVSGLAQFVCSAVRTPRSEAAAMWFVPSSSWRGPCLAEAAHTEGPDIGVTGSTGSGAQQSLLCSEGGPTRLMAHPQGQGAPRKLSGPGMRAKAWTAFLYSLFICLLWHLTKGKEFDKTYRMLSRMPHTQ